MSALDDEIWTTVRAIPRGKVSSYGAVGRELTTPISGLLVGRRLRSCPEGVPWWRVVGRDGTLLIGKLDPGAAIEQRQRLESEGIEFIDDRVDVRRFHVD